MDNNNLNFPRPKNFPYSDVFYFDQKFALMYGTYKNNAHKSLGLRWMTNLSEIGYPSMYGKGMWMVVPDKLAIYIIEGILTNINSESDNILNKDKLNEVIADLHSKK
ncbi:MAG: hypothetical protein KAH84_10095 [Thiomargarita sp.]|nr:hypothetical protein [Thiomargarita sp.]